MVWGCLTANGMGDLLKTDEIMNPGKYKQIQIHLAIPSGKRLIGNGFIFQHDNDPNHTSKGTIKGCSSYEMAKVQIWISSKLCGIILTKNGWKAMKIKIKICTSSKMPGIIYSGIILFNYYWLIILLCIYFEHQFFVHFL